MNLNKALIIAAGVLAAIAIVFGSIHAYSTGITKKAIEQTFNNINLVSMEPKQRLENPVRFPYIFSLEIANPDQLTAEVEIISWQVQMDEYDFETTAVSGWTAIIHPKSSRDTCFNPKGKVELSEPEIIDLKEKDIVPLVITGELKVTATYAWVTQSYTHTFRLDSNFIFLPG